MLYLSGSYYHMADQLSTYWHSPLGYLHITASNKGITGISFCKENESSYPKSKHPILDSCIKQLEHYFIGERTSFDLNLDFQNASEFYQDVWKAVKIIPHGKTRSYSDIANLIGHPKAQRAVGLANGRNPIPIIVPCHRVIGKNGSLTGYAYGLEIKQQLLALENPLRYSRTASLF